MERARRRRSGAALIRGSAGGEGWREALEISEGGMEGGVRVVGGVRVEDSWTSAAHSGPNALARLDWGEREREEEWFSLEAAEC